MSLDLLNVISTRGEISIEEFRKIVNELCLKDADDNVSLKEYSIQLLYYLDALGHCEFDFESRKVFACQPVLALLPGTGSLNVVLAGARGSQMMKKIKEIEENYKDCLSIHIIKQEREGIVLPDTVLFEALDESVFNEIASILSVQYAGKIPVAWVIANGSCDIRESFDRTEEHMGKRLNWTCRRFNPYKLFFQKYISDDILPQLLEYTNPISQKKIYLYISDDYVKKVERDWGRYHLLNKLGKHILLYDDKKYVLAVPSYVPLPRLLTRALTLCSGHATYKQSLICDMYGLYKGLPVDIYKGVTVSMAELVASKVGQGLNIFTANFEEAYV
ncbi:MAG: hypothetical protein APF77_18420 [Clostridia bacterium BRH_c25]|nr:MAG: hypothetical protein APF77_18420 [Clostridia bacterium BRH_c25]